MELLKCLYSINSKSGSESTIKSFFMEQLAGLDLKIEEDSIGNLFITKGCADSYPCVTAHLDEVHLPVSRRIVVDNGVVCAVGDEGDPVGCGADDKNGLWIIIRLLQCKPLLKVALFVQEEKDGVLAGCRGSSTCSMHHFGNVRYILAVDRKGSSDVVTVGKGDCRLCSDDFIPESLLEKYGYSCVSGGRTDVVALKERGLQQPCCNISCGYYNAHKDNEYTVFSEMENALAFVSEIVEI